MKCLVLLATLVSSLALAGAAGAAPAGGGDGVFQMLHTRGGKIGCQFASGGSLPRAVLRCDIRGGLKPRPPRPKRCSSSEFDVDWAQGIVLQATGRAQVVCAGDTTLGARGRLLRKGSVWRRGGIACHVLAAQRLVCANARGHGFVLSPRRWRVY